MELADIHRVREILAGQQPVAARSGRDSQALSGSLVVTLGCLVELVDRLGAAADADPRVSTAADDLSASLRVATGRAQILHAAAQGEPREMQGRR